MSGDNNSVVNNPLFGAMIGTQIGNNAHAEADQIRSKAEISSLESESEAGVMVAGILRKQVDALNTSDLSFTCSIAGVRGVTRELLEELRKADPRNPLLDKKIRDKIYDSSFKNIRDKVNGKSFIERDPKAAQFRDEVFGHEGSTKSGPEISKITPNIQIRSEAEVPSHTPDREKFLGLIEKLSAELKKANPNAPILQDKVMLDVFTDYTLNEMVRQEKNKLV